jgi:hypothetical protein
MPKFVVSFGFIVCDLATMMMTFLNGWGVLAIVAVSIISTISSALLTSTVGAVLWPSYFWESQPGGEGHAVTSDSPSPNR